MAINIDVRIARLLPNENPIGTTLAIIDELEYKNGVDETAVHKVNSLTELKNLIDTETLSSEAKQELVELEYLVRAGVVLLIFKHDEGLDTNLEDQLLHDYQFIVTPGKQITNTADEVITDTIALVKKKTVNAEYFVNINNDNLNPVDNGPKVTYSYNLGKVEFKSLTDLNEIFIPTALATVVRKVRLLQLETPYLPVAGETEGVITEFTNLTNQVGNIKKQELQEAGINPAILKPGIGAIIVAQNTSLFIGDAANPLAKGHITTLALDIKRKLTNLAEATLFKLNNRATWDSIRMKVRTLMNPLLDAGAIETYDVAVGLNETMTQQDVREGRLILNVRFTPVKAIEEINITLTILEGTADYIIETDGGI